MRSGIAAASDAASRDAAFRRLADQHLPRSYRLAYAILGNRAEAQDATHDAFIQSWRQWHTLRNASRFEHWFDRILVNTCRNRLKRAARWRFEDLSEDLPGDRRDPFSDAMERDALARAIATLSADHRVVVALRFYRDLTVDEIAARLGIRSGTVSSRLHYAMKRLQAALDRPNVTGAAR